MLSTHSALKHGDLGPFRTDRHLPDPKFAKKKKKKRKETFFETRRRRKERKKKKEEEEEDERIIRVFVLCFSPV